MAPFSHTLLNIGKHTQDAGAEDVPCLLVGNKSDLLLLQSEDGELPVSRQVPTAAGIQLAEVSEPAAADVVGERSAGSIITSTGYIQRRVILDKVREVVIKEIPPHTYWKSLWYKYSVPFLYPEAEQSPLKEKRNGTWNLGSLFEGCTGYDVF